MKIPLSFEDYLKDPLKYIQFILILVVGYLWIDNKMNYQSRITEQQFIPQTKDLWDFLLSLLKLVDTVIIDTNFVN